VEQKRGYSDERAANVTESREIEFQSHSVSEDNIML
jgi:hypothetical protein